MALYPSKPGLIEQFPPRGKSKTPWSQLRGKQSLAENIPDVITLEATEIGPPQTFVWLTGLVTLNGFLMDVIEAGVAELATPEAEYEVEAEIPGTFFSFWSTWNFGNQDELEDPLVIARTSDGDHCEKDDEDEETAGEVADMEAEVVKPFELEEMYEPLGLLTEP